MEIQQRLNYLANHDVLTGLPNRALFQERLDRSLAQAKRHRSKLVLMFVELDNFKNINDSLGHAVGDRLLKVVGQRLLLCIRESDTVARLGGDEFAVVLESVEDVNNVARIARSILEHIAEPLELAEREVVITASIGVTVFPEDALDSENLCRNADTAVYRAKELGRNGYQFFTADLTVSASQRMMLEYGLRNALERDEFELHYQPKVMLADNRVCGVEALLRWNNRELGLVSPDVFVPVLESTGLISEVGDWVLNEACRFVAQMQQHGHELGVAVNVSARQMLEPRLAERIEDLLQKHRLGSSALELEITESMLIENIAPSIDELAKLRVLGVKVSVDDFGTGYSSLGYLKRLPIDTLKIDRTFVRDLPNDGEDVAITSAIVALAGSLELETIAEGVETLEQVEFLRGLGCHQAQGYFFSRPLQGEQLLQWLEQEGMTARYSMQTIRRFDDDDPLIDKQVMDD
jgi:diguanylate cyclase (GGDEF)-like protein